jgi:protein O-GlcNAc transferase
MQKLAQAIQSHQNGELAKAKSLYTKVIKRDKSNAQAHYLLGLLYHQQSKLDKALKFLKRSLAINPAEPSYTNSIAKVYVEKNDIVSLRKIIEHCTKYKIDSTSIQVMLAKWLTRNGQANSAITTYERLLENQNSNWNLWLEFGNCLFYASELEQASRVYRKVLQLIPEQVDALNNLAAIALEEKDLEKADGLLLRVLKQKPKHLIARYNLANILYNKKQWNKAKRYLTELLSDSPEYFDAHLLSAKVDRALGNHLEAIKTYERLIERNLCNGRLYNDYGNCYFERGDFESAYQIFVQALLFSDAKQDAQYNLATCSLQLKKYENAVKEFAKLLDLQPDYHAAYAPHLHALRQCCLWEQAKPIELQIRKLLQQRADISISPFSMITLESSTSEEQVEVAHHWAERQSKIVVQQGKEKQADWFNLESKRLGSITSRRIKLGYFSADFHDHATAILLVRVLELHDKNIFECYAYSYGPNDRSPLRKRVENAVENFKDLREKSKQGIAEIIKQDNLDILVDLKGFTQNSLSEILLARLAPVQINFLGYPASMGKALVDYVIVDEFILSSDKVKFDERPLVMPHSYQPTDNTRVITEKPSRSSLSLKDEKFVFAAFHQGYKLNQKTIETWANILKECPQSVLWCLSLSQSAESITRQTLQAKGVEPNQIIFASKVPPHRHITRLQCADLVLDSFPVNGHTTTSDSLWAGVPVVTIAGDTFISRVAGSLLSAAGLPEFICRDFASYQAKAIEMYHHPDTLKAIRKKLKAKPADLPLFNSEQYTKDLESLYKKTLTKNH